MNLPEETYHVFARGNNRASIFIEDGDQSRYLSLLGAAVTSYRWRCFAYCLMPNHVHLLLQTPEPNLSAGMRFLHGRYAQVFNKRHGRCGHVFQGRFGAVTIESHGQLRTAALYLARNPVAAGLCQVPEAWPWSSYSALTASASPLWFDTALAIDAFGVDPKRGLRTIAELVRSSAVGEQEPEYEVA